MSDHNADIKRTKIAYVTPRWLLICAVTLFSACTTPSQTLKGNIIRSVSVEEHQTVQALLSGSKRLALLIGVNQFEDSRWTSLSYTTKDALDMSAILNDARHGQFDRVITLTTPEMTTRDGILKAIDELERLNLSIEDTVVFYVSTHGTLTRTESGELQQYIVARDTRYDDITGTAINVNELKRSIGNLKSQKKVMIFAFCNSGTGKSQLPENIISELKEIKSPFFVKPIEETSEATIVLAASAWGETASESKELQNDIYTYFLIEGIRNHDRNADGAVTVTEAHDYAKEQTYYLTRGGQRPSIESVISGTDPIILSGNITRRGNPIVYDYSKRYENMVVKLDGEVKGTLPLGIAVMPGKHRLELASHDDAQSLYASDFVIDKGDQLSIPILLHGHDHGTSIRIGYQAFLTDKIDRQVTKPLPMLGVAYTRHAYFSPRLGFRMDLAYGQDHQQLDTERGIVDADVSQAVAGAAVIYRNSKGDMSWYGGPRLGGIFISRDFEISNTTGGYTNSATIGGIFGLHFRYNKQFSMAIEGTLNYANIEIDSASDDAVFYNLFSLFSYNF